MLIYHVIDQLMLLILCTFIVGLVFLGFINQEHIPSSTPPESRVVFEEVAENLSGTAIPEYVLTYGTPSPQLVPVPAIMLIGDLYSTFSLFRQERRILSKRSGCSRSQDASYIRFHASRSGHGTPHAGKSGYLKRSWRHRNIPCF